MRATPLALLLPLFLPACAEFAALGGGAPGFERRAVEADWAVFSDASGDGLVCWAATQPFARGPDGARAARDGALVMVTTAPQFSAQVPDLADGEGLSLTVAGQSFPAFAAEGSAWLAADDDEARVLALMGSGGEARLSDAGGAPLAEFSLQGFGAAHAAAVQLCAG